MNDSGEYDMYEFPHEGDAWSSFDAVGAPLPPPTPLQAGAADLLAKLAVMGLTVAAVAGAYAIFKKMSKSETKSRRQASRSAMKILSKAAERQSARAVEAAGDRATEFLTSRRLPEGLRKVRTEVLNQT